MVRWRLFLTVLILVALPLKGVAALAMPFCGPGVPVAAPHDVDHGAHASDHVDHGSHGHCPGDAAATDAAFSPSADCEQCAMCHLACASGLPFHAVEFRMQFRPVFAAVVTGSFVSFIPEVLFRPPLRPATTALA